MKRNAGASPDRHWKRLAMASLGLGPVLFATCAQASTITLPPISVSAATRASFTSTDADAVEDDVNDFNVNSVRLQISGSVTEQIKMTFNTDYNSETDEVVVIDAIGRFEFSPKVNIWAGRFLPPSDRANLHGPYYGNAWGFAVDGIQDGYPFEQAGRDDGLMYWGDFDRVKVSVGVFDVPSTKGTGDVDGDGETDGKDLVYAGRIHVSLWGIEKGYYLNGTYYGDMDVLSFGVAAQSVDSDTSVTVDGLMEKKLGGGGVVSLEGEYATYEGKAGGYGSPVAFDESDGFFALAAYLFPQQVGIGKFQILGKYAANTYEVTGDDIDRDQFEVDLNYVIKTFNARISLFYIDTEFDNLDGADFSQVGLGLQLQI